MHILPRIYELIVRSRTALYRRGIFPSRRLRAPVISIGNLTTGGTGKTPLTAFIAGFLRDEGLATAILSRGYKRTGKGLVEVSDGSAVLCDVKAAGDEPYLLAINCPGVRVVVNADRYAAGRWLESKAAIAAFILDDGFQHLRLQRDLNIVLLDATEPLDEAALLPAGRLREPLHALQRADAIIITRADHAFDRAAFREIIARHARAQTPVFHAWHRMTGLRKLTATDPPLPAQIRLEDRLIPLSEFARQPVAALSGIARPDLFIADLESSGLRVVQRTDYRDHHRFTSGEINAAFRRAETSEAVSLIITEKDAVRLPGETLTQSALPILAARIEFCCEEEDLLKELILKSIRNEK